MRRWGMRCALTAGVVVASAACYAPPQAAAAAAAAAPAPARASAPAAQARATAPAAQTMYATDLLRPGDVIRLRIWREPELSGEFIVDESGTVVFPKIGVRHVVRQSPDQLKRDLLASYDRYLVNPSVEIAFLRRINILGAVARPGLYPVDATMTVADALALAGGTTSSAKRDQVELVRGGQRLRTRMSETTVIGSSPILSGDQLYVPERSWLAQNAGLVSIGVSATLGVLSLLRH